MTTHKLGILISGSGSNMIAILDEIRAHRLEAEAVVVISNIDSAPGLSKARDRGVETLFISHKGITREEHDRDLVAEFKKREVSLVCLAGYMRLISPSFVRSFRNRILNIHPSLLPAFPGLNAQRQAIEHGVKVSGCTVHLVDEHLDQGPIVMQRAVEVRDDDTVETLSTRILEQEHRLYPKAIARVLANGFRIEGRQTFSPNGPSAELDTETYAGN